MGVKRAVDLALELSSKHPGGILTLGPLIHNSQTVEMLRQRGVTTFDEENGIEPGTTFMIRAHGIPPETQESFSSAQYRIIDGTCPKVKTVHKVISKFKEQKYEIVITGDQGHAEVIGLLGYAGNSGHLIGTVEELSDLPEMKKICMVSQTTFDRNLFDKIATELKEKFPESEIVIKKTICAATDQRQAEIQTLAGQVEALIVVGGKNSANTQRLAKISRDCGTPTQLVETEDEINWGLISRCNTVGVTAGASTPNWMIKRVTDYLQFMGRTRKRNFRNVFWNVFDILANLNIFAAFGAVAAYYVSCILQGYSFTMLGATLSLLYFLSMYLWNSLASIESTQHHCITRYIFYQANKKLLLWLSGLSIVSMLLTSLLFDIHLFYLMFFASMAGSVYHLTIVPERLKNFIHYKKLKDIPTSRDLFVALAWSTVLTFIPQVINSNFLMRPAAIATFVWIFILSFLRSLIFDLRDIEGDRILGRETLITIVGEKRARKAMQLIIWFCLISLLLAPAIIGPNTYRSQNTLRFLLQIPTLLYITSFIKWNPRLVQNRSPLFNLLADGLFYLAALGGFIASIAL